ncbi:MAG: ribosome silencing factor [Deltaproteobacteria bacterium]|nr:ribosome silencing factor [Deltaproteobacteria bacterium]
MTHELDPFIDLYIQAALGRKAFGLVVLDVHEVSSVADIVMICSGRSNRQVTAIAEFIVTDLKKHGIKPLGIEGIKEGHWVLLDYGHVIIHVFYEPIRNFYDLEGLWTDAERIKTDLVKSLVESQPKEDVESIDL